MAKKAAVLAVDPVNGLGLFQYLETFFENEIPYKVFAVAEDTDIKSNSGLGIAVDDVITNLKGHGDEYDALVFACGDAIPRFADNSGQQYNQDLLEVIREFDAKGKLLIGHCGAALIFETAGVGEGKRMAIHPYAKPAVKKVKATDEKFEIDGNFYTAQTENTIWTMMPQVIRALK